MLKYPSKDYISIKELCNATGIGEGTLRIYLGHYTLSRYLHKEKNYKLSRTPQAIGTFLKYLKMRSRIKIDNQLEQRLYRLCIIQENKI